MRSCNGELSGSAAVGFTIYFGLMIGVAEVIRVQTGVVPDVIEKHAVPALRADRTPTAGSLALVA